VGRGEAGGVVGRRRNDPNNVCTCEQINNKKTHRMRVQLLKNFLLIFIFAKLGIESRVLLPRKALYQ
jgi:hypothetical protein